MIRRPQTRLLTTLALTLLLAAQHGAPAWAQGGDNLPPPLRAWMSNEQGRMSRSVDQTRLMALTNLQDPRFSPETGATFPIKSYWVDAQKMDTFQGLGLDGALKQVLTRTYRGNQQVRLLVHPESEGLYRDFLRGSQPAEDLMATATASSRTLLVWPRDNPNTAFFAKVSLDKEIGGVRRTISGGEVARSVGINNVIALASRKRELPANFGYIPEVLSTIPRGMKEGGMVIRAIPKEVIAGKVSYVPLFSLYAEPKGGGRPLLAEMIAKSGMAPQRFVREKLIQPLTRQYMQLSMLKGIIPEPHAQNVLLEVGPNGLPTGRFIHRDFGGFNIDFGHRKSAGLALPSTLPQINSLEQDYKVGKYGKETEMVGRNLDAFLYGGFVFNLDKHLPGWSKDGTLPRGKIREGTFKKMLVKEIEAEYTRMSGKTMRLGNDLRAISGMVDPVRSVGPGHASAPLATALRPARRGLFGLFARPVAPGQPSWRSRLGKVFGLGKRARAAR